MDAFVIFDEAHDGATNMAIDEALLEHAGATGNIYLRFYAWSEPTLSLGYFQSHADRRLHPASSTCAMVRRPTGGGAIVHDHELTYSLSVPVRDRTSPLGQSLYQIMHETLISTLADQAPSMCLCDVEHPPLREEQPFLCFERRSVGDVLLDNYKIGGSAQRRRHGGVMQHGSVLTKASPFAGELPGICDLAAIEAVPANLPFEWSKRAMEQLDATAKEASLPASVVKRGQVLSRDKYTSVDWNQRR